MKLEKFFAEKLSKQELQPVTGGDGDGGTNCKTAWTRSSGKDSDTDVDGKFTDEDADIYLEGRLKKKKG